MLAQVICVGLAFAGYHLFVETTAGTLWRELSHRTVTQIERLDLLAVEHQPSARMGHRADARRSADGRIADEAIRDVDHDGRWEIDGLRRPADAARSIVHTITVWIAHFSGVEHAGPRETMLHQRRRIVCGFGACSCAL